MHSQTHHNDDNNNNSVNVPFSNGQLQPLLDATTTWTNHVILTRSHLQHVPCSRPQLIDLPSKSYFLLLIKAIDTQSMKELPRRDKQDKTRLGILSIRRRQSLQLRTYQ